MRINVYRTVFSTLTAVLLLLVVAPATAQEAAEAGTAANEDSQAIRELSESLVDAFNRKDAENLAALFLPDAQLIDDAGNTHHGRDGIQDVFTKFIELFPDAKMDLNIETVRLAAGELAIENGTRTVSTEGDAKKATNRYMMVHVKRDGKWQIAVAREVPEDPEPTPHDRLARLVWLVGDWVDEDAEATITISCRWAESGNFLLADFAAKVQGETVMESKQRIGWDPLAKGVRSWVFDSDGGYGEGCWTEVNGNWIIKSTAVLPDGTTGSATIFFEPLEGDRFLMKGFDRVQGNSVEPDFEATIVRKPPQPTK